VQAGVGDHNAADRHRPELCDRGERTGPSDLDLDAVEHGHRLLGGELVGERPARGARDEAEAALQL